MNDQTELVKFIEDAKLDLNEGEQIKQSYLPFYEQLAQIKEDAKKINFNNPTQLDEKIAKDLRLRTVKVRTGSLQVKDERKRIHALKADLEQQAWNLIKATCLLEEENFEQIEKKREIEEKARKELLKKERTELLSKYCDNASIYPLGDMTDTQFDELFKGLELSYTAKLEAELKAEKERQAAIEAEKQRQAEIEAENARLKADAEEKEKELAAERAKADAERKAMEEKARIAREASEKEAKRIKAENDAKLAKERAEKAKLEAELKAKADVELKAKQDAEEKAKHADIERIKAEKAPDKEKLKNWVDCFAGNSIPIMSEDGTKIAKEINEKFESFKNWAKQQIEKL